MSSEQLLSTSWGQVLHLSLLESSQQPCEVDSIISILHLSLDVEASVLLLRGVESLSLNGRGAKDHLPHNSKSHRNLYIWRLCMCQPSLEGF
jgi:hypothetical protein